MATKKQKQVERMYLEIVRSQVNDFPTEPIRDGPEPPDFLVVSMRGILAIEITRIYRDTDPGSPPPKSQDAERDLVVERAQALAEDRSVPPLFVDVYFASRFTIRRRDRDSIAQSLVDLVASRLPAANERLTLENRHPLTTAFPEQVEAVSMWRSPSLTSHLWQTGDAGIVSEDFAPQLQRIIKEKNARLQDYQARYGKCWLVVVADWLGHSSFFEISDRMASNTYPADFDRVYFLEFYSGRVVDLSTRR